MIPLVCVMWTVVLGNVYTGSRFKLCDLHWQTGEIVLIGLHDHVEATGCQIVDDPVFADFPINCSASPKLSELLRGVPLRVAERLLGEQWRRSFVHLSDVYCCSWDREFWCSPWYMEHLSSSAHSGQG